MGIKKPLIVGGGAGGASAAAGRTGGYKTTMMSTNRSLMQVPEAETTVCDTGEKART